MTKTVTIITASAALASVVLLHTILIHRPPLYFGHGIRSGIGPHTDVTCDWGLRAVPLKTNSYIHATGRPIPVTQIGYEVLVGPLRIDDYWR